MRFCWQWRGNGKRWRHAVGDLYMRQYHFPKAVANARRKVRQLEDEARAMGMRDIANSLEAVNRAWDREVEIAKLGAAIRRGDDK